MHQRYENTQCVLKLDTFCSKEYVNTSWSTDHSPKRPKCTIP